MTITFGVFEFDSERHQLTREGSELHLTPKAFDLLKLLIESAPRVLSKTELHERLWPTSFVSDATLVGLVKELRRALDDRDPAAPLIRTVQRVGYAFGRPVVVAQQPVAGVWHWILVEDRRIALSSGESVIGRDPRSAVWLDFPSVSRKHARIVVNSGQVVLEDMGSKNGTTVGTERLNGTRELRDGDRLTFGTIQAIFCSSTSGLPTVTLDWSRSAGRS